jgi:peptidoglycan-associated lipoprotein
MKRIPFSVVFLLLCLSACKKVEKQEYPGIEGDTVSGTPLPARQEGVSFFGNNVAKGQFAPIYFPYDSATIGQSENDKLQRIASFAKSQRKSVILAGFTDERGTEEYNRALGERRAETARNSLISLGVPSSNIQTVSFGLEMPADPGHTDSAWAKNRRVETGVVR